MVLKYYAITSEWFSIRCHFNHSATFWVATENKITLRKIYLVGANWIFFLQTAGAYSINILQIAAY